MINPNGYVGLGTAVPTHTLDVSGGTGTRSGNGFFFRTGGDLQYLYDSAKKIFSQ
jgi:hypothetical protein